MDVPVVGWLVVVKGPGRGRSVPLGYGMNPIGRDTSNRVSLPFDDEQISRKKHAIITYDPRGRKFYFQHGDSSNLSYVGEMPVLAPTLLEGGETIRLGDLTVLRFVPLCGGEFTWEDS
jgi:pSer/pThr/pTyr-binding forkhead associated (FHA) protein